MEIIRPLNLSDYTIYQQMDTGIADDYMLTVFERLVTPPNNYLFGIFVEDTLAAVTGYTHFPGGNVMLGRLRSERTLRNNGYPTRLLTHIVDHLKKQTDIQFLGGYTQASNLPAKRLLEKLNFSYIETFHSFVCLNLKTSGGAIGSVWREVSLQKEKTHVRNHLSTLNLAAFPYEAYYPFPYHQSLLPDWKLASMRIFKHPVLDRYLMIENDYKGEKLAHVRYPYDDLFTVPGLIDTVQHYLGDESDRLPWFDFTIQQYQSIPNLSAFRIEDPWELHGYSLKNK